MAIAYYSLSRAVHMNTKNTQHRWFKLDTSPSDARLDPSQFQDNLGADSYVAEGMSIASSSIDRRNEATDAETGFNQELIAAIQDGNEGRVSRLLDGEHEITSDHCLQVAVTQDKGRILRLLLDKGLNPDTQIRESGKLCTLLQVAAIRGYAYVARVLLEAGADFDARGEGNNTHPLHLAVQHDHLSTVKVIVAATHQANNSKQLLETALDHALSVGNRNAIARFLKMVGSGESTLICVA